ncbi:DUF2927 domain-containing protein [Changchengzhania lutea]|uniref:DUF2927 domain-containing protein n=1 Tax=Changchengzhania lutea TaxID=2049305 RepID=UPI00115E30AB|nr:DUF2927 domain-containing protein [Changchengzhania lutea]
MGFKLNRKAINVSGHLKNYGLLILVFFVFACSTERLDSVSCENIDTSTLNFKETLFLDLAFNQEFGGGSEELRKWNNDISIYIVGNAPTETMNEINVIISEISDLNTDLKVRLVQDMDNANLILFLGLKPDYIVDIEPSALGLAEDARGFANILWNTSFEIVKASICIDVINNPDLSTQKHIIREELGQAFGLINDTVLDDTSMFHETIENSNYSETDLEFMTLMLSNSLEPGMCQSEALKFIN